MNEEIIVLEEEVETIEEIIIEEGASVVSNNVAVRHSTLEDRFTKDQHLITSITGLREELDNIEALQTVYSDSRQQADYYKWQDENAIPQYSNGLFVSLYTYITNEETGVRNGTGNIQICDGTTDVFGVTVDVAGFIGNQSYIELEDGTKIGRDGKYSLVAHSGLVAVQRKPSVKVGDYIVPDADGKAKKSDVNALRQDADSNKGVINIIQTRDIIALSLDVNVTIAIKEIINDKSLFHLETIKSVMCVTIEH